LHEAVVVESVGVDHHLESTDRRVDHKLYTSTLPLKQLLDQPDAGCTVKPLDISPHSRAPGDLLIEPAKVLPSGPACCQGGGWQLVWGDLVVLLESLPVQQAIDRLAPSAAKPTSDHSACLQQILTVPAAVWLGDRPGHRFS
jgi:hypothetical protein